jgi:hypothetical protein
MEWNGIWYKLVHSDFINHYFTNNQKTLEHIVIYYTV